jgi:hypothetical protein
MGTRRIALPGQIKPYHIAVGAGVARAFKLLLATPPWFARYKLPLSGVLGRSMALAVWALAFGVVLLLIGKVIHDNKLHESLVGQWAITAGCLAVYLALYCTRGWFQVRPH